MSIIPTVYESSNFTGFEASESDGVNRVQTGIQIKIQINSKKIYFYI